jgi:nucleoside-diphosphate-sugar epimerase
VDANVTGTLNLLEACRVHEIPRFVLSSSSSVYGDSKMAPFREGDQLGQPLSPYAATKRAAEDLCATYRHLHGLQPVILRYFTVYGPAGRPDMSPFRFVRWIAEGHPVQVFGDGRQTRDFTYVDDIAGGTVAALDSGQQGTFNLGSDSPVALMELIRLSEKAVGRKADIRFLPSNTADVAGTWADISKAQRELGWSAAVGLEDGVDRLARWYFGNREWASVIEMGS